MLSYLRLAGLGAGLALVLGSYAFVYHLGGNATRAAAEAAHAAQLATVVDVLERQRNAAQTESDRRKGIIDAYDLKKDIPSPSVPGLARRVLVFTPGAGCGPVPRAAAMAVGTVAAAALPGSDASAERLLGLTQAVFDAADGDAKQMTAMIALATPPVVVAK